MKKVRKIANKGFVQYYASKEIYRIFEVTMNKKELVLSVVSPNTSK
ncbi:hypothetical protein [Maribacter polysaccharolyticus]|nr:hypothetical protein [Maribacter polysaccharolyticus]MDE3742656.1 hypothetical protein [Maribacter polysaccharolyticus]